MAALASRFIPRHRSTQESIKVALGLGRGLQVKSGWKPHHPVSQGVDQIEVIVDLVAGVRAQPATQGRLRDSENRRA
jgi:hypothetical protein